MFGGAGEPIYLSGILARLDLDPAGPKSRERQPPRIMVWKQWAAAACGAMMAGLAAGHVSSTPSPCLFLAQARGRSDLIRARSRATCHARRT